MKYNKFSELNFESILLWLNIILFSEIFTLFLILFPSSILAQQNNVIAFYLFLVIYFIASVLAPWLYIFFIDNSRKFLYIIGVSCSCFFIILILKLLFPISLQIVIYFIFLKTIMAGLAALFKSIFFLFDKQENVEKTNFNFQGEDGMKFNLKTSYKANIHKNDIIGGLVLLLVYPVFILLSVYFYSSL